MRPQKNISDLESINPAFSAKVILVVYKVVFAILFILFLIGPFVIATRTGSAFGILSGLMIALPATLILVLVYNHLTRVSIASLMTWHFARETALASREILEVLRGEQSPRRVQIKRPHLASNPEEQRVSNDAQTPVVTVCPSCGARFRAKTSSVGKTMACPKCGNEFTVLSED